MRKFETPIFTGKDDGVDLEYWISWMENYFAWDGDCTEDQKLQIGWGFIYGEAFEWLLDMESKTQSFETWNMLTTALRGFRIQACLNESLGKLFAQYAPSFTVTRNILKKDKATSEVTMEETSEERKVVAHNQQEKVWAQHSHKKTDNIVWPMSTKVSGHEKTHSVFDEMPQSPKNMQQKLILVPSEKTEAEWEVKRNEEIMVTKYVGQAEATDMDEDEAGHKGKREVQQDEVETNPNVMLKESLVPHTNEIVPSTIPTSTNIPVSQCPVTHILYQDDDSNSFAMGDMNVVSTVVAKINGNHTVHQVFDEMTPRRHKNQILQKERKCVASKSWMFKYKGAKRSIRKSHNQDWCNTWSRRMRIEKNKTVKFHSISYHKLDSVKTQSETTICIRPHESSGATESHEEDDLREVLQNPIQAYHHFQQVASTVVEHLQDESKDTIASNSSDAKLKCDAYNVFDKMFLTQEKLHHGETVLLNKDHEEIIWTCVNKEFKATVAARRKKKFNPFKLVDESSKLAVYDITIQIRVWDCGGSPLECARWRSIKQYQCYGHTMHAIAAENKSQETLGDHTCAPTKSCQSYIQPWYDFGNLQSTIGFNISVAHKGDMLGVVIIHAVATPFEKLAKTWRFKFKGKSDSSQLSEMSTPMANETQDWIVNARFKIQVISAGKERIMLEEFCCLQHYAPMLLIVRNEFPSTRLCLLSFHRQRGPVLVAANQRILKTKEGINKVLATWEFRHFQVSDYGTFRHKLLLASETFRRWYKKDSWLFLQIILKGLRAVGFAREKETIKKSFEVDDKNESSCGDLEAKSKPEKKNTRPIRTRVKGFTGMSKESASGITLLRLMGKEVATVVTAFVMMAMHVHSTFTPLQILYGSLPRPPEAHSKFYYRLQVKGLEKQELGDKLNFKGGSIVTTRKAHFRKIGQVTWQRMDGDVEACH